MPFALIRETPQKSHTLRIFDTVEEMDSFHAELQAADTEYRLYRQLYSHEQGEEFRQAIEHFPCWTRRLCQPDAAPIGDYSYRMLHLA